MGKQNKHQFQKKKNKTLEEIQNNQSLLHTSTGTSVYKAKAQNPRLPTDLAALQETGE